MSKIISLPIDEETTGAGDEFNRAVEERDSARRSLDWDLQCVARYTSEVGRGMAQNAPYVAIRAAEECGVAKHKFEAALRRFRDASGELAKAAKKLRENGWRYDDPIFKVLDVPHPDAMREFDGS